MFVGRFDEYASLMGSDFEEYASLIIRALERLSNIGQSLAEAFKDYDDLFISIPTKKQLKYKQPKYRINYIQPQIIKSKYLPYQRRIY